MTTKPSKLDPIAYTAEFRRLASDVTGIGKAPDLTFRVRGYHMEGEADGFHYDAHRIDDRKTHVAISLDGIMYCDCYHVMSYHPGFADEDVCEQVSGFVAGLVWSAWRRRELDRQATAQKGETPGVVRHLFRTDTCTYVGESVEEVKRSMVELYGESWADVENMSIEQLGDDALYTVQYNDGYGPGREYPEWADDELLAIIDWYQDGHFPKAKVTAPAYIWAKHETGMIGSTEW